MRFAYDPYAVSINLNEGDVCFFQIENKTAYTNILSDLYMLINYGEGESALYDDEKALDFKKCTDIILEPFSLDLNNKKIKAQLYRNIVENAKEKFYSQIIDVCGEIQRFIGNITDEVPYSTTFDCQFGVEELLKLCNVSMYYPCDSIAEKLNVYIKLLASACNIKTVFIADVERYVNSEELNEIIKTAKYDNINLLLICSESVKGIPDGASVYILDESLCFWKAEKT